MSITESMCIGGFVEPHGIVVHIGHACHPVMVQMDPEVLEGTAEAGESA